MKTAGARSRSTILLLAAAILISACATTINPNFMDPGLSPAKIDKITVLPVVDLRKDRSIVIDRERLHALMVYWSLNPSRLELIGYREIDYLPIGTAGAATIEADDIAEAKPQWIRKLGPSSVRWALLITLNDFMSTRTYGVAVSVACSGYLFDKEAGKLVWRHEVAIDEGEGGLIALLAYKLTFEDDSYASDVLRRCSRELVEQFPPRKSKH
jgi:hypothetical protein